MSNSIRQLNKLFIGNLPWTVSHAELKKYFSEFGQISQAIVMFDKNTGLSKGYGFVSFLNKEATDKVFNTESHVLEGNRLNVQPSDSVYNSSKPRFIFMFKMADKLEDRFNKACDHLPSLVKKLDSSILLRFYGLYKQATVGECNIEKPSWYSMDAKAKYNAWNSLEKMGNSEAMLKYIELLNNVDDGWENKADEEIDWDDNTNVREKEIEKIGIEGEKTKGWVNVSSMVNDEVELNDTEKNIYEWAKEGNVNMLSNQLSKVQNFNINQLDDNGLSCLHWACDRGHLKIAQYLIEECGADINVTDGDGDTSLDYAKAIEHHDLIEYLLKAGAH